MPKAHLQFAPVKLAGKPSLRKKRVKQSSGKTVSIYSLDAESANLATDLNAVFAKNVAAARRANSALPFDVLSLSAKASRTAVFAEQAAKAISKISKKSSKKRTPKG
jgi:hypothetical protein